MHRKLDGSIVDVQLELNECDVGVVAYGNGTPIKKGDGRTDGRKWKKRNGSNKNKKEREKTRMESIEGKTGEWIV